MQDPQQFEVLFNIIDEEVSRNDHTHGKSCTKGLLWLKRWVQLCLHSQHLQQQLELKDLIVFWGAAVSFGIHLIHAQGLEATRGHGSA